MFGGKITGNGSLAQQEQAGFDPEIQLAMIAVAHPTPGFTEMASSGQLMAQAPHSMQRSLSWTRALPWATANTP